MSWCKHGIPERFGCNQCDEESAVRREDKDRVAKLEAALQAILAVPDNYDNHDDAFHAIDRLAREGLKA